jgi:putative transposase
MSRTRYRIYEDWYPYFLTCTIVGWLPVFSRPRLVEQLFDSWRWLQTNRGFKVFGYVILENHLHLVASCDDLGTAIGDFKSFTARQIVNDLKARGESLLLKQLAWHKEAHKDDRSYQVWQEGSHPQQIQNEDMMRQKLEYTHYNPVKRGYVDQPEHWRYSSARDYAGMPGLFPICREW